MKQALNGFILAIPILFIKQFLYAWIANLQREHALQGGRFYVDQPPFPWVETARKILILMAGAGLLAWLFKGQLGLGFWQIFRDRNTQEGLLMSPRNPNGFTRRIEKLFIAPQDREKFMEQLPHGFR